MDDPDFLKLIEEDLAYTGKDLLISKIEDKRGTTAESFYDVCKNFESADRIKRKKKLHIPGPAGLVVENDLLFGLDVGAQNGVENLKNKSLYREENQLRSDELLRRLLFKESDSIYNILKDNKSRRVEKMLVQVCNVDYCRGDSTCFAYVKDATACIGACISLDSATSGPVITLNSFLLLYNVSVLSISNDTSYICVTKNSLERYVSPEDSKYVLPLIMGDIENLKSNLENVNQAVASKVIKSHEDISENEVVGIDDLMGLNNNIRANTETDVKGRNLDDDANNWLPSG